MILTRLPVLGLAFAALVLGGGGCGGAVEDGDVVVSDDSALSGGPEVSSSAGAEDDAHADHGCRDGDHDGHQHHRKHWFKVLDRLDGAKDGVITLASLPPGLPERLIARLQKIDRNGDGLVTKKEAKKAWRHRHAHRDDHDDHDDHDGDHDGDDRDDD